MVTRTIQTEASLGAVRIARFARSVTGLALIATAFVWTACASSNQTDTGLQAPPQYSADVIDEYRSLANAGYQALDAGNTEKAVESFTAQLKLIPTGKLGAYNLACVYGRTGDTEKGIYWLSEAVKNGWDSPDDLLYDSDLASLKSSPEFGKLVKQSEATRDEKSKLLANGLPEYKKAPVTFANQEEFDQWSQQQSDVLKANRNVWQDWQYAIASLDFYAKRLAAERELRKDDPSYDYGLYRVRTIGNIKTIWDCWGALSDGVVKEAKSYLATHQTGAGVDEANYYAGLALAKKYCDDEPTPDQKTAEKQARGYFAKVSADSPFHGSADAWLMEYKLADAKAEGPEKAQALYADVRSLIKKCREDKDQNAMRIISVGFHTDAVKSIWPLDLDQPDFDGRNVSLADYKGKVLLIDFWATWCGPCMAELPNVKAVYKKYHPQGLEIVSVSLDYDKQMSKEALQKWTKEKGMNWRHIYEGKGWNISLADKFLVKSIPSVFLVGRDGNLIAMGEDVHGPNLAPAVQKALAADFH